MAALLYNRSSYTLLSSTLTLEKLAFFSRENGYETLAIADKNVMYGAGELYHLCLKYGLKPVYGLEAAIHLNDRNFSYVLYARNNNGFLSLIKLSTCLNSGNEYLEASEVFANKDLAIIDVDAVRFAIENNDNNLLNRLVTHYRQYNVMIGLEADKNQGFIQLNQRLRQLVANYGLTAIAMPLACMENAGDSKVMKTLAAIKTSKTVNDDSLRYISDASLLEQGQLFNLFRQQEIINADHLADSCNVEYDRLPKASLPVYENRYGVDNRIYLQQLAKAGLARRLETENVPERYSKRLNYELKVICQMNFQDYFLIIMDIIRYGREKGIYIGLGRGSAAGSLVAYCLGITHIDPLKYGLIFERFLNPERVTMPDIDIDIPDNRRQEIIDYLHDKYGYDHVAQIITFNTMAARQALRDTGKALDLSDNQISLLTKTLSRNAMDLKGEYERNRAFRSNVDSDEKLTELYQIASKLQGLPRVESVHAAGTVITREPLITNMPLIEKSEGVYVTQYTMKYLEELGLIKIDLLGLRNLTIIANIIDQIKEKENFDIFQIPLDDEATYRLLAAGDTSGIFQLESEGMRRLIRQIKPVKFDDLVVAIALYRPGPMENIPAYLEARQHPGQKHYVAEELRDILKETHGVIIYQEQIMQIAQRIAGFSMSKADELRQAISKKNEEKMISLHEAFVQGAVNKGYNQEKAEEIYAHILKFASYGFNKSHSVAYGILSYQMAYLKTHYPNIFYKALLDSNAGSAEKTREFVMEARSRGLSFLLPDVNKSSDRFLIEDGKLRYPLTGIKDIDSIIANIIIKARNKDGAFKSYVAFLAYCKDRKITREVVETLIKAGALDCFGYSRNTLIDSYNEVLRAATVASREVNNEIIVDFSLLSGSVIMSQKKDSQAENLRWEYEYLGVYLREHPVERFRRQYPSALTTNLLKLNRDNAVAILQLNGFREHRTRTGEIMCFAYGQDEAGEISVVFMPDSYSYYKDMLKPNIIVMIEGKTDERQSIKVRRLTVLG